MKKAIVVVLMALVVLAFSLGVFAFQNEPDGFRGLKWGDPPAEDMKLMEKIDGTTRYVQLREKLYLGDAKFSRILYHFHQDEFLFVNLDFSGNKNYELLDMICWGKFGEADSIHSGDIVQFFWFGSLSNVYLSYRLIEGEGMLIISESKISDRKEQLRLTEVEEQLAKAEGDW